MIKKNKICLSLSILLLLLLNIHTLHAEIQDNNNQKQAAVEVNKDFFQTTLEAYKDFNECIFKYFSFVVGILSIIVAIGIGLFFYFFRKTLQEMKSDLQADADRMQKVYEKTFELLNKQADSNLGIFKYRDEQLKSQSDELKEMRIILSDTLNEITKEKVIKERVANARSNQMIAENQKLTNEFKEENKELEDELNKVLTD